MNSLSVYIYKTDSSEVEDSIYEVSENRELVLVHCVDEDKSSSEFLFRLNAILQDKVVKNAQKESNLIVSVGSFNCGIGYEIMKFVVLKG